MEVVKSRLDLPWPYNYKALDLLSIMPLPDLIPLAEKLKVLSEAASPMEGAGELKKLAKPLYEKAMVEQGKVDEEEARKKQDAIAAMWGGLWANDVGRPNRSGWGDWGEQWYYPWAQLPPGVAANADMQMAGRRPEGWYP